MRVSIHLAYFLYRGYFFYGAEVFQVRGSPIVLTLPLLSLTKAEDTFTPASLIPSGIKALKTIIFHRRPDGRTKLSKWRTPPLFLTTLSEILFPLSSKADKWVMPQKDTLSFNNRASPTGRIW